VIFDNYPEEDETRRRQLLTDEEQTAMDAENDAITEAFNSDDITVKYYYIEKYYERALIL
jgi:hypothetical protein